MNHPIDDITDSEIRIIGADPNRYTSGPMASPSPASDNGKDEGDNNKKDDKRTGWSPWLILLGIALIGAIIYAILALPPRADNTEQARMGMQPSNTTQVDTTVTETVAPEPAVVPNVTMREDTINDITLVILTPEGCRPQLHVGNIDSNDSSIMLCAQAADLRGDNGDIVSAFVLKGEPLSRGVAKRGFCAIIDGTITLGMSEETPLYERVVESGGDFFRQYPLVHESQMQENKPKGKAIRKALCMIDGTICIIMSKDKESFHDFAQALQDYGVTEAITLTGSTAALFYRDKDSGLNVIHHPQSYYKKLNYIIFKK